jgi:Glycine rich protein/PEP-CTERM motif
MVALKSLSLAALAMGLSLGAGGMAGATVFDYTGSLQTFVAPQSGVYDFIVDGAQGGDWRTLFPNSAYDGGAGAEVAGQMMLATGTVLTALVGGVGESGFGPNPLMSGGAGGGGGSFLVVQQTGRAVAVAGGGGGATRGTPGSDANEGYTISTGVAAEGRAGGGGSLTTDGSNYETFPFTDISFGGRSFVNGGAGGAASGNIPIGDGGYGGGGGASQLWAGGGGGYSGGSAGFELEDLQNVAATGGGSFWARNVTDGAVTVGANNGNGSVTIFLDRTLSPAAAVPEPSTWAMFAFGFAGLGLAGLRAKRSKPLPVI